MATKNTKEQNDKKIKEAEEAVDRFCCSYSDLVNAFEDTHDVQFEKIAPQLVDSLLSTGASKREYEGILLKALCNSIRDESPISSEVSKMRSVVDENGMGGGRTALQQYFTTIGKLYDKNNNNYDIEYCDENREKLIEMNLKSVISIAKRYIGNGLSLEELISAGNEGLCIAFDKYDPSRQKLRDEVLKSVEEMEEGKEYSYEDVEKVLDSMFQYGSLSNAFNTKFKRNRLYKKQEVMQWVNKNVRPAKFNSIAVMWINAYIIIELDKYSRIIRKPKKEIKNESAGLSPKDVYYDISSPIGDDGRSFENSLPDDTSSIDDLEIEEAHKSFRNVLQLLLEGVSIRNRRIIMQRYGIGLPRPMSPKEISQRENISIARISQIIKKTMDAMQHNYKKHQDVIDPDVLYDMLERCGKCM